MSIDLSNNLITYYGGLASVILDTCRIQKIEDLKIYKKAFKALLDANDMFDYSIDKDLKSKITSLRKLLNSPENYVEDMTHCEQFRIIVQTKINEKIKALKSVITFAYAAPCNEATITSDEANSPTNGIAYIYSVNRALRSIDSLTNQEKFQQSENLSQAGSNPQYFSGNYGPSLPRKKVLRFC